MDKDKNKKGCAFCNDKAWVELNYFGFKLDGNLLEVDYDDSEIASHGSEDVEINYCPMCGRKLVAE